MLVVCGDGTRMFAVQDAVLRLANVAIDAREGSEVNGKTLTAGASFLGGQAAAPMQSTLPPERLA